MPNKVSGCYRHCYALRTNGVFVWQQCAHCWKKKRAHNKNNILTTVTWPWSPQEEQRVVESMAIHAEHCWHKKRRKEKDVSASSV